MYIGGNMLQQTSVPSIKRNKVSQGVRSQRLVHFFRAVALFSVPLRSVEFGLRRRK